MRVIAGTAKSIKLDTIEGDKTRPTTDRTKETLFNIIQYDVQDCVFLDLFCGSGAIGIEALSRGAKQAFFVDNNREAVAITKKNLKKTKLEEKAKVIKSVALASIGEIEAYGLGFDIIFMDPPYNKLLEKDILLTIEKSGLIHDNTIIIVEASIETDFQYLEDTSLHVYREKNYKTSKHVFIRKNN
ncbi:MAG: 16S rRNA (guanine(966)-N(2))-methyltransferase RsmD [Clostridiales bacterium]|jgi:16S rRNA (guanine966-N2)-methyltransferase|nr:16S rRNA (guanine(966)-N(2))-methyltransferase RsmD [Clostridiales bacterium]